MCCPLFAGADLLSNDASSQNLNSSTFKENLGYDDKNNQYGPTFHTIRINTDLAGVTLPTKIATPLQDQKSSPAYSFLSIATFLTEGNSTNIDGSTKAIATATDSDGDGLTDSQETELFRTNMNKSDSDTDGLSDAKEVNGWFWFVEEQRGCTNATLTTTCHVHKTNPLSPDTDGDRNSDNYEYITFGSDPVDPDQDKDGLLDGLESGPNALYRTSFFVADTDGDGFSDGQEIKLPGRDPNRSDNPSGAPEQSGELGVNNAPIAITQTVVTVKNDPIDITFTGNDREGDRVYFFIATHPLHGTISAFMITGSASAKLTYTPGPNYIGSDSFTFWAYDGKAYSSSPGRIFINISQ